MSLVDGQAYTSAAQPLWNNSACTKASTFFFIYNTCDVPVTLSYEVRFRWVRGVGQECGTTGAGLRVRAHGRPRTRPILPMPLLGTLHCCLCPLLMRTFAATQMC